MDGRSSISRSFLFFFLARLLRFKKHPFCIYSVPYIGACKRRDPYWLRPRVMAKFPSALFAVDYLKTPDRIVPFSSFSRPVLSRHSAMTSFLESLWPSGSNQCRKRKQYVVHTRRSGARGVCCVYTHAVSVWYFRFWLCWILA